MFSLQKVWIRSCWGVTKLCMARSWCRIFIHDILYGTSRVQKARYVGLSCVSKHLFMSYSILFPSGKISVILWWVPSPLCWMKTLFRGCSWRASLVIEDDDRNRLGFNLWNSKGAREMNTHKCTRYTYSAVFKMFQYCMSRWHFGGNTEY